MHITVQKFRTPFFNVLDSNLRWNRSGSRQQTVEIFLPDVIEQIFYVGPGFQAVFVAQVNHCQKYAGGFCTSLAFAKQEVLAIQDKLLGLSFGFVVIEIDVTVIQICPLFAIEVVPVGPCLCQRGVPFGVHVVEIPIQLIYQFLVFG